MTDLSQQLSDCMGVVESSDLPNDLCKETVKTIYQGSLAIERLEAECARWFDRYSLLSAENKRLEALDKNWLRASEQWVAENKVLAESLLEAMEWNWCDDDWPEVMGNTFKQYADYALERVSTEPAPDGINDRGSDEYANPERDGDRQ